MGGRKDRWVKEEGREELVDGDRGKEGRKEVGEAEERGRDGRIEREEGRRGEGIMKGEE